MSILLKSLKSSEILRVYRVSRATQVRHAFWYPDYKPGPYPETAEEKKIAAKKYNLIPEEYQCYDENTFWGDYPKLPFQSVDTRDPWYPWDNEELRKDFNDPVHIRMMNLVPEFLSTAPQRKMYPKITLAFIISAITYYLILKYAFTFHFIRPVSEKQYPAPGVVHYTFELDDVSSF